MFPKEFVWWQGVIEDMNDPQGVGRIRVRVIGHHTEDLSQQPLDTLPWAPVLEGTTGMNAANWVPGDWVMGYFLDGNEKQKPLIMGRIPGIPDEKPDTTQGFADPSGTWPRRPGEPTTPHSARGKTRAADHRKKTAWNNPVAFAAKYPFNKVIETDKGALFELDDTEGAERVLIMHHKGSYVEFLPDGTVVVKSVAERWDVSFKNHTMLVNGDLNIGATGDVKLTAGGDLKLSSGGSTDIAAGGALNLGAGGSGTFVTGGQLGMNGSRFDWGKASDATGGPDSVSAPGDTSPYDPLADAG